MWKLLPFCGVSQLISRLFESFKSQWIVNPLVILIPPAEISFPPPVKRPVPPHDSGASTVTERGSPGAPPSAQLTAACAVTVYGPSPLGAGFEPENWNPLATVKAPWSTLFPSKLMSICEFTPSGDTVLHEEAV